MGTLQRLWNAAAVLSLAAGASCASAAPLACLIEAHQVAEIGAAAVGVLRSVHVERGSLVAAGQLLASMDAGVERAALQVADLRSRGEAEERAARSALELAAAKLRRAEELYAQDFISKTALDQTRSEHEVAAARLSQARENRGIAGGERALAASQLAQREIRAPFSGVVVERFRTPGERIEREPIVRIAQINPLRVELLVPAELFGKVQLGQSMMVRPRIPGLPPREAKVALIDPVLDAASNTFRVQLTMPNPLTDMPAGARCEVEIGA